MFEKLGKNPEFQRVYHEGISKADKYLVMYADKGHEGASRYGFSVSKRIGNSVMRHRVTRLFREAVFKLDDHVEKGSHIIIIARPPVRELHYEEICKSFIKLFKAHHIWKGDED